jgi:drug/metabolite transporter (DMT)-like permease
VSAAAADGPSPRRLLRGNLVAVASTAVWASAFPATDALLRDWSPLPLAAARLTLAALATLAVLAALGRARELAAVRRADALLFGGLGVGGSVGLLVAGQALAGGVVAAIVASMVPAFATALDATEGRLPDRRRLLAVALAVAGGAVAAAGPGAGAGGGGVAGALLLAASGLAWTWGSRGLGRAAAAASDLARSCAGLAAGAAVLALAAAVAGLADLAPARWSLAPDRLPLLLWMGAVGIGLSFPLWIVSVRMLGLTVASLHGNLAPLYVILFATLAGGGAGARELAGGALVVAAAVLAQLPARRRPSGDAA